MSLHNTIVISQPMYFPWVGLFEQILLSDIFVFYEDVQFSKGSFTNRVQIKTQNGIKWLSIPLKNLKLGQNINEVFLYNDKDWKMSQLSFLENTYKNHKYNHDVIELVHNVFKSDSSNLSELTKKSILEVMNYFNITKKVYSSVNLFNNTKNSQRVLNIANYFGAKKYLTGHGAKNYLDHKLFEESGIEVLYIDYQLKQYPQLYGTFTPYVSILDLIANTGKEGIHYFGNKTTNWKEFIDG